MLVITDLEQAPDEGLFQELFKRYTNVVIIYERLGPKGNEAQNGLRYFAMLPAAIGLCEYALMRLNMRMEKEIKEVDES